MAEIAAALPDAASRRAVFVPGDKVVVISGDLINLEGVVTKVRVTGVTPRVPETMAHASEPCFGAT